MDGELQVERRHLYLRLLQLQVLNWLPQAPKCGLSDPFFYLELAGKEKSDTDRKSPIWFKVCPLFFIHMSVSYIALKLQVVKHIAALLRQTAPGMPFCTPFMVP